MACTRRSWCWLFGSVQTQAGVPYKLHCLQQSMQLLASPTACGERTAPLADAAHGAASCRAVTRCWFGNAFFACTRSIIWHKQQASTAQTGAGVAANTSNHLYSPAANEHRHTPKTAGSGLNTPSCYSSCTAVSNFWSPRQLPRPPCQQLFPHSSLAPTSLAGPPQHYQHPYTPRPAARAAVPPVEAAAPPLCDKAAEPASQGISAGFSHWLTPVWVL